MKRYYWFVITTFLLLVGVISVTIAEWIPSTKTFEGHGHIIRALQRPFIATGGVSLIIGVISTGVLLSRSSNKHLFEGEKTFVFWIGLIISGLASVGLLGILWILAVWNKYVDPLRMFKYQVPFIVGGVVFIVIGLYMMKSGVEKKEE